MRQSTNPNPRVTPASVEAEVIANIRGQRLGPGTVTDLNLPEAFLKRVAGRIIQTSYNDHFRVVVNDGATDSVTTPTRQVPRSEPAAGLPATHFRCPSPPTGADTQAAPPPSRGFAPHVIESDGDGHPFDAPAADAPSPLPELAHLIATSLARDGLIQCAADCLAVIEKSRPLLTAPEQLDLLRRSGLPSDLLCHFAPNEVPASDVPSLLDWIKECRKTMPPKRLRDAFKNATFKFGRSTTGFDAICESGQYEPSSWRLHLTRGDYYAAKDDGGSLDILRQVLESTRAQPLVQLEERHLEGLRTSVSAWPAAHRERISLLVQDLPLSQWSRDNGIAGALPGGRVATLLPRFASRGEEVSNFVAGDTYAGAALQASGRNVSHSPLLFQGGNLITVQHPLTGERTLLIGEAEVYRNRSLGLSQDQVLTAFKLELGVDRCAVLPAASIHIDYEVSVRAYEGGLVAFVNDSAAAARIIVQVCLKALHDRGQLSSNDLGAAEEHIAASRPLEVVQLLRPVLSELAPGRYPLSLAQVLQSGPGDSGVGNFQRFLAALDVLTAASPKSLAAMNDPHQVAFLLTFARQEKDRSQIREQIKQLGWRVVAVPSLAIGNRSVNAINGIHTPTSYLMPAYGGLFEPLDRAAVHAISGSLGPQVAVIPILCGESQRRDGALHCSVNVC